jgi:hypothetical protein
MKYFNSILFLTLLVIVASPSTSFANITAVGTSQPSANVAVTRPANLSVQWKVVSDAAAPVTISSASAEFRAGSPGGPLLEAVKRNVAAVVSTGAAPHTVSVNERLQVPAHVVFKAHKMGYDKIVYTRSFTDGGAANSGSYVLNIRSSAAANFNIQSLSLLFDDESKERHVLQGDVMHVLATVQFGGSGLLQAVWEVAEPVTSNGNEIYRTLLLERRRLAVGGRIILASPELPTVRTGLHKVRLRITQPYLADEVPELTYSVAKPPQ